MEHSSERFGSSARGAAVVDLHVLLRMGQGLVGDPSARVELSKKLDVLQTQGMHEGPQNVDEDAEEVSLFV